MHNQHLTMPPDSLLDNDVLTLSHGDTAKRDSGSTASGAPSSGSKDVLATQANDETGESKGSSFELL